MGFRSRDEFQTVLNAATTIRADIGTFPGLTIGAPSTICFVRFNSYQALAVNWALHYLHVSPYPIGAAFSLIGLFDNTFMSPGLQAALRTINTMVQEVVVNDYNDYVNFCAQEGIAPCAEDEGYTSQSVAAVVATLIMHVGKDTSQRFYPNWLNNRWRACIRQFDLDNIDARMIELFTAANFGERWMSLVNSSTSLGEQFVNLCLSWMNDTADVLRASTGTACIRIMSYSRLTFFSIIHDAFLITKSPVLLMPRLSGEMAALVSMVQAMAREPNRGPFLGIIKTPGWLQTHRITRSAVPLLFAAAKVVLQRGQETLAQLVVQPANDEIVQEIVALHDRYIRTQRFVINDDNRFLAGYTAEEYRELFQN